MKLKLLACIMAVLCMMSSLTAFAYEENTEELPLPTATPKPEDALTPEGQLTLVDDKDAVGKQFITVETRSGACYYIIIDRSASSENVYFLNLVDDADLLKILEDNGDELPAQCSCTDKCAAGDVNTACPVCKTDMSQCEGTAKPMATTLPDSSGSSAQTQLPKSAAVLCLLLVLCIGGAVFAITMGKGKKSSKGKTDLNNYDFSEDDEEEEYETEEG